MAVEFTWKKIFVYTDENGDDQTAEEGSPLCEGLEPRYIRWEAKWDGQQDNDPLWYEEDLTLHRDNGILIHPFSRTIEYEDLVESQKYYSTEEGKKFAEKWNISTEELLEDQPEELREVGDIVAYNPVTVAFCEMLSNDAVLKSCNGNTHPAWYRASLFGALSLLWD